MEEDLSAIVPHGVVFRVELEHALGETQSGGRVVFSIFLFRCES
jgi:hypothetical protein